MKAGHKFLLGAALIVGSFPHAQQMDEIAKALKWDKGRDGPMPIFYKRLEVQRREIVPKGAKRVSHFHHFATTPP